MQHATTLQLKRSQHDLSNEVHAHTVYLCSHACVRPPLPGLHDPVRFPLTHTLVWLSISADSPLTQEGGHRAQLNLWTKRCSLLMTQWDLPVRAWSMPAAVSADAQLSGTTL